eukprot:3936691-Rhodomonas_salina.1
MGESTPPPVSYPSNGMQSAIKDTHPRVLETDCVVRLWGVAFDCGAQTVVCDCGLWGLTRGRG